jgi:GT2 family glycosyltransferase
VANPSSSSVHLPSKTAPAFSVIIPVYASGPEAVDLLRNALEHLKNSSFQDFEILVADDASPRGDAVRAVAQEAGAELVRLEHRSGPATARNAAAKRAAGDILIFMDADTSVHTDTLDCLARKFRERPGLDAAMGSYDQRPTAPGVVSHFRNLLHSFVHHRANHQATTFWAGCGAVRKERFQTLGGFDESFPRPSIEDVEFGLRLHQAGGSIHLDPQIQVTHHKSWTLSSMIGTDFSARAIPWARLLHTYPMPLDLNFKAPDRISGALAALTSLVTVAALLHGGAWWLAPMVSLTVIALLNWPLFRFLARATSWGEAILCFPLLLIYLATCVTGLLVGLVLAEHQQDRWLWPAAAIIGLVLLTVQISGGAFKAEFTGHPDESAQLVSGLMVYDYLAALPRENPISWAGQYYLHYPKVAIGHWPPGYHLVEAVWWLFLGPSRTTSMLLQWLIGVVTLTMLYRLSRSML